MESIREIRKILAIKRILKEQSNPRDYLLFTMGINDLLSLKVKDVLDKKGEIVEYLLLREQKTKKEKKIKNIFQRGILITIIVLRLSFFAMETAAVSRTVNIL